MLVLLWINQQTKYEVSNFTSRLQQAKGGTLTLLVGTQLQKSKWKTYQEQEIRSVEHGICPIAEFTSPYWIVRIVTEYRILFSVDVAMYMYCLKYFKKILSEYWKVTRLFKPLPRYRNF